MQRPVTLLVLLAALASAACEDGPDQTFSPAPPNASAWNAADAAPIVGVAGQGFDASTTGGQNANNRCTAVQEKEVWTKLLSEPISPPGLGGGLDIAGGPNGDGSSGYQGAGTPYTYDAATESWSGATVLQAEDILCQGTYVNIYTGATNTLSWGENNEFGVMYNADNLAITDLLFQTGYAGTFNATSRDGKTTYSISLDNQPINKTVAGSGTSQILLNWNDPAALSATINELYDAYIATYAPTVPSDASKPGGCFGTGHCEFQNNGSGGGNIFFSPIGVAIFTGTTVGTPQQVSIINLIDVQKQKILPFSTASVQLQLDSAGVGPFAYAPNVGGSTKTCKYTLGMAYSDFDANCVQVFSGSAASDNATEEKKLFNSIAHDDETYDFNIFGVDPQFSATLAPNTVVSDTQRPSGSDTAIVLNVDQGLLGPIANDYTNNDTTQAKDLHGIGLVTLEWANLVQQHMKQAYGVTADLGNADCIKNPASPAGGEVCSGIEGIVTSAPPALVPASMKVNALGANAANVDPNLLLGLKPQTWFSVFCAQSGAADGTGYGSCIGGNNGFQGYPTYYFDTMQDAITLAYGTKPVPTELTNRRFFFEEWVLAFVKYLQTADKPATPLIATTAGGASIDSNPVDPNELFFDSAGSGFENAEYVFRALVNPLKQAPTTLIIGTNLLTSLINNIQFERFLYRPERELYQVLTTKQGDLPGSENLLLSNMVGSPVLAATYGTYACAINQDPTPTNACGGVVAPLDTFGQPLYAPYEAAFGQSFLHIAAANSPASPSPMVVDNAPYTFLAAAMTTIPEWSNPYDPTTAAAGDPSASALATFFPKNTYTGFPVLVDGSRDKFYSTNEVDIPGTASFGSTVQGNIDFEYVSTSEDGGAENALVVRAIETPNYLGLVFACAEPSPTVKGATDVLGIRMYDNANVILDWISAHQATGNPVADCSIYFKRSVYGNYFDFISFNQSGVRVGLNPGFGGSVVSDVTIFDPNVIAGLGQ